MADKIVRDESLTAIADAIREKVLMSDTMVFPQGFVSTLNNVQTTGDYIIETGTLSFPSEVHELPPMQFNFNLEGALIVIITPSQNAPSLTVETLSSYASFGGNIGISGAGSGSNLTTSNNSSLVINGSTLSWVDSSSGRNRPLCGDYFFLVWGT